MTRLWRWLWPPLPDQIPEPVPDNKENITVTTTAPPSDATEAKLTTLHAELSELDTADAADPILVAEDRHQWATRSNRRRDRKVEIMNEIDQLRTFGELLDDADAMASIRNYTKAVGEPKVKLRYIADQRAFPQGLMKPEYMFQLNRWWTAIEQVGAALPAHDPNADRWLIGELELWFTARDGMSAAFHLRMQPQAVEVPAPELAGPLPGGFTRQFVRAAPASDGAA